MRVLGLEWWTFRPYRLEAPSFGVLWRLGERGLRGGAGGQPAGPGRSARRKCHEPFPRGGRIPE